MPEGEGARLSTLLEELRAEFPRFRVIEKNDSRFQRLIHYALVAVTFGQMREYLDGYHTYRLKRLTTTNSPP